MDETKFELAIERHIDASADIVWKVWTERLAEWWCPKPWTTEVIELDLRPGGRSAMIMRGPAGEEFPQEGVVLEVVPRRRVVFTDAFTSGWVPSKPFMVGFFEMTPDGRGTRYRAGARHWSEESMKQHEQMNFTEGWSKVADQLAVLAETEARA